MPSSYQFVDALLFLFTYSSVLRPAYVVVVALAVLAGVLAFHKYPPLRIGKSELWKKLTGFVIVLAVVLPAFLLLQHHKLLNFDADDPRCDRSTTTVLYLPMWIDRTLAPYLDDTYQHFSSTCEDLRDRISSSPLGWSRHVTLGAHLALSFIVTALIALIVANVAGVVRKGGLTDE